VPGTSSPSLAVRDSQQPSPSRQDKELGVNFSFLLVLCVLLAIWLVLFRWLFSLVDWGPIFAFLGAILLVFLRLLMIAGIAIAVSLTSLVLGGLLPSGYRK